MTFGLFSFADRNRNSTVRQERLTLYDNPERRKNPFRDCREMVYMQVACDFKFSHFDKFFAFRQRIWWKENKFWFWNDSSFISFIGLTTFVTRKKQNILSDFSTEIEFVRNFLTSKTEKLRIYSLICDSFVLTINEETNIKKTTAFVRFGWNLRFDRLQFCELRKFSHFIGWRLSDWLTPNY